jgi:hypothetical protein
MLCPKIFPSPNLSLYPPLAPAPDSFIFVLIESPRAPLRDEFGAGAGKRGGLSKD